MVLRSRACEQGVQAAFVVAPFVPEGSSNFSPPLPFVVHIVSRPMLFGEQSCINTSMIQETPLHTCAYIHIQIFILVLPTCKHIDMHDKQIKCMHEREYLCAPTPPSHVAHASARFDAPTSVRHSFLQHLVQRGSTCSGIVSDYCCPVAGGLRLMCRRLESSVFQTGPMQTSFPMIKIRRSHSPIQALYGPCHEDPAAGLLL